MTATELISDEEALQALADEWWALWHRCPAAHPFQSPAWLIPWWRAFRPGRLASVALRERGRLVALAPLYLEDGPLGRRLLPIGIGITDYLDLLVDPSSEAARSNLITEIVQALVPDWERLELEELAPGAAALDLSGSRRCEELAGPQSAAPVLVLSPDCDLAEVPAGKRRKLRMSENRVRRRRGEVRRLDGGQTDEFLRHLVRLHGARWSTRGEEGVLGSPQVQRFHELALPLLDQRDLARIFVLEIEGRVAGAHYGLHRGERSYAYLGGFDPDFAFESPGTALLGHALREAAREGAREFHFLRGQERYKYEWGAVDRWTWRRSFVRRPHV